MNWLMNKYFLIALALLLATQVTVFAQNKDEFKINDSTTVKLTDVVVKGQRPVVKASAGKLQYNIPNLIKNKPVDNAFDVLREVPGLTLQGDAISIIGAQSTNIIINNRLSSLTLDQVINLLKSTSANKVKKVEVMYSTPPQYGVRGASVNIIMGNDKLQKDVLKGEVSLKASQAYYFTPSGRLSLGYAKDKFSTDFSYAGDYDNSRHEENMGAFQTVNNNTYTIEQRNRAKAITPSHNVRGVLEYEMADSSQLTFSYTGSFDNTNSKRSAETKFVGLNTILTNNHITGPSSLNSFRFDFVGKKGLTFGGDYVIYSDDLDQALLNLNTNQNEESITSSSTQKVQRVNVYANMTHKLANDWELNYGLNGLISKTSNKSIAKIDNVFDKDASFEQIQNEQNAGGFIGFTKSFGEKLSLQASLSLQYYKATTDSLKQLNVLWERLDLFPTMSLEYNPNENNTFQLSFSSDKSYPSYMQTSPSLIYLNAYSVTQGNPALKPSRSYSTSLNYVFLRKYVMVAFANHESGSIQQMPYQSINLLRMNFNTINMDYRDMYGISVVIPFKIGSLVDSKITTTGTVLHDKGKLIDIEFNRKKVFGSVDLDNTIFLTKKKDLFCTVSGNYNTSAIQGIYTIDPTFDVSSSLVWKFADGKARLILKAEDIFNGQSPYTHTNIKEQRSNMSVFYDSRLISLSFKYNFSGYKKKEVEDVDTSRFGNKF